MPELFSRWGKWSVVFTGTRAGMTARQLVVVREVLGHAKRMQNGGCVGSDVEAARVAKACGVYLEVWPSTLREKGEWVWPDEYHQMRPPLVRNRLMVEEAAKYPNAVCLATPQHMAEALRSGTWATVRYARKRGMRTIVVYPDGTVEHKPPHEMSGDPHA